MKRHETDLLSLIVGCLAVAAGVWALAASSVELDIDPGWVVVAVLALAGSVGLVKAVGAVRRTGEARPD